MQGTNQLVRSKWTLQHSGIEPATLRLPSDCPPTARRLLLPPEPLAPPSFTSMRLPLLATISVGETTLWWPWGEMQYKLHWENMKTGQICSFFFLCVSFQPSFSLSSSVFFWCIRSNRCDWSEWFRWAVHDSCAFYFAQHVWFHYTKLVQKGRSFVYLQMDYEHELQLLPQSISEITLVNWVFPVSLQ